VSSNSCLELARSALARVTRFFTVSSRLRKALAISETLKPHKMCNTSAICDSSVNRGLQQENIMRS
jgi:hypothetical protein